MIRAMHYLAAGLLILGFAYSIQIFYNVAAGIMLGFGIGSWIQWKAEQREFDKHWANVEKMIKMWEERPTVNKEYPNEK